MSSSAVNQDFESLVLHVHFPRVFLFRIWLGCRLMHLAMWVIGARVEVIPPL